MQAILGFFAPTNADNTLTFMFAGGLFFIVLLALPGGYYSLQQLMGHPPVVQPPLSFSWLDWVLLLILWPLLVLLGSFMITTSVAWAVMPVVSVLTSGIPVFFILRLALNRLQIGTRQRAWSVLGLGLTVSPLVIFIVEIVIVVVAVVAAILFLAAFVLPNQIGYLEQLTSQLEIATEEEALSLLGAFFFHPGFLLPLFGFIAVIVPLVEEIFKTLPLWFFGKKLNSPAEGFLLGAVSGAAFALFENIGYAANDSDMWATVTLMRFGAASMHIFTGALMGWGLAQAFVARRGWLLAGIYVLAAAIHALWNAIAVSLGLGILAESVPAAPAFWRIMPFVALPVLIILCAAALVGVIWLNRTMQASQTLGSG